MREPEMARIAGFIATALRSRDDASGLEVVRKDVAEMCAAFPAYPAT
jgi:glycine/serine hydroxymethyltransferase